MNDVFLSIIVPIYNVENYIEKCIASIIQNTSANFELILVIDGSPDNSISICKKYKEADKRIVILEKENGGLSDARNAGYKIAKGEYIWFVDGDDYIESDSIDIFFEKINKETDIFLFNYQEIYENKIVKFEKFENEEKISGHDLLLKYNNYGVQAWTQIYSKNFLDQHKIIFEKGAIYEDVLFNTQVYSKNPALQVIDNIFVNYVQRGESIMKKKQTIKNVESVLKILELYNRKDIINFFPKKFIINRHHYYFSLLFIFLHKSNMKKDEIMDLLNSISKKNFFVFTREYDSFIVKYIKRKLFPSKSVFIYKNWNFIFLLIRLDNLINR
ncbi:MULTISPECIES: glycosyltransferase [Chryseobacterium]|uniref:Glycosyltransferase n=1 Tax=Chryseobacterium cucumeris TaxID=1813611 RepID=A0ABX9XAN6_9FLAO|nr:MULTISPECIES: glycosyltransferase [Chryseobacterium]ROH95351.1 glycosyltransferase [Chryseobacterium cucumeris]WFB67325.1 glycosyltransferase [Chryseobacterium sp. WX]